MRVLSKGSGPALVFFHGPWGLSWDPFLDRAGPQPSPSTRPSIRGRRPTRRTTSITSTSSGISCSATTSCSSAGLDERRVRRPLLRRHGGVRGGGRVSRRVRRWRCIEPLGFWRDADPIVNWMMLDPARDARATSSAIPTATRRSGCSAPDRAAGGRRRAARAADVGDGRDRQVHLADPRQGPEEADPPRDGADAARVGQGRSAGAAGVRRRVHAAPRRRARADGRRRRPRARISSSRSAVARMVREFLTG